MVSVGSVAGVSRRRATVSQVSGASSESTYISES